MHIYAIFEKQLANLENKSILNYLLKLIVIRQKFQASYPWRECVIFVHMFQSQCAQLCHCVCVFLALFGEILNSVLYQVCTVFSLHCWKSIV